MTTTATHCVTQTVHIPVPVAAPMPGYLAQPATAKPSGAVIVGMELFGISAHVRDVCDRLARLGYLAIAPDLYHRSAPGIELPENEQGRARGFQLLAQLTRRHVLTDISATIDYVAGYATPLAGMVGLSVGGHIAYLAAAHLDLPATAIFYGGWIPTTDISISQPDPTIDATASITGRVQMFVGNEDSLIPPDHRRQIADALRAAHVEHELIEYPQAGHGFLSDRRPSYDPSAAHDAWTHLTRFLAQTPNGSKVTGNEAESATSS